MKSNPMSLNPPSDVDPAEIYANLTLTQLIDHLQIFDLAGQSINLVAPDDLRILHTNRSFNIMFGYQTGELHSQHASVLNAGSELAAVSVASEIASAMRTESKWQGTLQNRHKNGFTFWTKAIIRKFKLLDVGEVWLTIQTDINDLKRAETELGKQSELLSQVTETIPDMVYFMDRDHRVRYANRAALEFGRDFLADPTLSLDQVLGRTIADILGASDWTSNLTAADEHAMVSAETTSVEDQVMRYGTPRKILVLRAPILDGRNSCSGLVGVVRDITGYLSLKHERDEGRAHLNSILRAAPIGIGVLQNRILLNTNPAMSLITGYSPDELKNMPAQRLYASDVEYEFVGREKYRLMSELGIGCISTRWQRKDGRLIDVYLSSTPIADGDLAGKIVFTAEDITERNRLEHERLSAMVRQRDTLVREVHHRIKNHLQGVIGLLRAQINDHPLSAAPLLQTLEQIKTIANVYGLQSSRGDAKVSLCDLLRSCVTHTVSSVPVLCHCPSSEYEAILSKEELVPIALILGELLVNAQKHLDQQKFTDAFVRLSMEITEQGAKITFRSTPANLPPNFDIKHGDGIGTGLELVLALMPATGAILNYRQQGEAVDVEFILEPPVIGELLLKSDRESSYQSKDCCPDNSKHIPNGTSSFDTDPAA